jgi:2-hydroxychromene-2-carboxylate isomerase
MNNIINFYYDFSSSYSYIAQARVNEIEEKTGKKVAWRPIVLGAIFKQLAHSAPNKNSPKLSYMVHDLGRCAKSLGIAYKTPDVFPFNAMEAMRIFYFLQNEDINQAIEFSKQVFHQAYSVGEDVSKSSVIANILSSMDRSYASIVNSESFNQAKATLKQHTQKAMEAQVFGAPSFIYQDELFWGADRVDALIEFVNHKE